MATKDYCENTDKSWIFTRSQNRIELNFAAISVVNQAIRMRIKNLSKLPYKSNYNGNIPNPEKTNHAKTQAMGKMTRRKFIITNTLATMAFTQVSGLDLAPKKGLFVHHVYFWLKNPGSEADKAKLIEGLEILSKVPEIKMAHIGTPASTDRSVIERGYAVSWLLFFENLEEEEVYQKHPDHLKFIENCSHLWEKVIVYDSVGEKVKS